MNHTFWKQTIIRSHKRMNHTDLLPFIRRPHCVKSKGFLWSHRKSPQSKFGVRLELFSQWELCFRQSLLLFWYQLKVIDEFGEGLYGLRKDVESVHVLTSQFEDYCGTLFPTLCLSHTTLSVEQIDQYFSGKIGGTWQTFEVAVKDVEHGFELSEVVNAPFVIFGHGRLVSPESIQSHVA